MPGRHMGSKTANFGLFPLSGLSFTFCKMGAWASCSGECLVSQGDKCLSLALSVGSFLLRHMMRT